MVGVTLQVKPIEPVVEGTEAGQVRVHAVGLHVGLDALQVLFEQVEFGRAVHGYGGAQLVSLLNLDQQVPEFHELDSLLDALVDFERRVLALQAFIFLFVLAAQESEGLHDALDLLAIYFVVQTLVADFHYVLGLRPVTLIFQNEIRLMEQKGVLHFFSGNVLQVVVAQHLYYFILGPKSQLFLNLRPEFARKYLD